MWVQNAGPFLVGATVLVALCIGGIQGSMGSQDVTDRGLLTSVALVPEQTTPMQVSVNWTVVSATGLCGPPGSFSATVQFFGNVTGGSPPYTFYWTFGDGSVASTLKNPEHTYTTAPDVATLTTTDSQGIHANESATLDFAVACPALLAPPLMGGVILILVIGLATGVVVGLVVYGRKRKRRTAR